MRRYPTIVAVGLSASFLSFAGCGTTFQSDAEESANKLILQAVHDFGEVEGLPVATHAVNYQPGQMSVTGDVPADPDGDVSLILSESDLLVRVDHDPLGQSDTVKRSRQHHVEVTFRLASHGLDPCDSEVQVGPVEARVEGNAPTLAERSLPLHPRAAAVVRNGSFNVCAEIWGDFDGSVNVEKVSFGFNVKRSGDHFVEICHIPPGDPDNRHTITVGAPAVERHLAHGDYLGACEASGDDEPLDSDGDGVTDLDDECPETPAGDEVYSNGCSVVVLTADAGGDLTVVEGETVSVTASADVVQGEYSVDELVYVWKQVSGPDVLYESSGLQLTAETNGVEGVVVFLLTVSTHDDLASFSDELTVTINPAQIVGVVAGKWHNVAMLETARIAPWGTNRYGQLGDGSLVNSVNDVDAGATATLVALDDGTAWSVGANTVSTSAVPVEIVGVAGVVQVAAQAEGGLLLDGDGIVWGFGDARNLQCELGGEPSPTAEGALEPAPVSGLPDNVVAISAGSYHGVALDADGVAWIWGSRFGCTPMPVIEDVVEVAAGDSAFCLFLLADGTVWGIGSNSSGQLGNGTMVSSFDSVTPVEGLGDVVHIAAGYAHSLFVTSDGALWAAGWNRYCQLGVEVEVSPVDPVFGTVVTEPAPVGLTNVTDVAAGYLHSVAVQDDGTLWVWGSDGAGQLSTGTLTDLPSQMCTPVAIELAD